MEFSIFGILAVVLELFRPILLPLGVLIAADLLLLAIVIGRHRRLNVARGLRTAASIGVVLGLAAALYFPVWTGAGLTQLQSLVDYLAIIAAGVGIGFAAACAVYPPVQLLLRKTA
ncbi:DUF5368 family protein [Spiribacter sp. 1M153]|uniref:DUF5368 family protein n=1 Tax=Spiribacter TaxID=1335745 RepID=UPI000F6ECF19|nr:DUF5368 family protein [Spiribacter sp. SSL99]AUB78727.1 hypothetical protein BBH56_06190 [Spiribacter roseus]KAF0286472.1 hypothetical protein BA899_08975 [Spiribacter sp. SSL99]